MWGGRQISKAGIILSPAELARMLCASLSVGRTFHWPVPQFPRVAVAAPVPLPALGGWSCGKRSLSSSSSALEPAAGECR